MTELADEAIVAQEHTPQKSVETNETGLVQEQESIVTQDDASALVPCPICQEPIREGATKCRHCGDYLDQMWATKKTKWLGGKSLWDVLGLIIIPLTIAGVGLWLADTQDRRQLTVESNRAMSNTLQAYLDDMSDVILHEDLEDPKTQSTMRARTISTISELDGKRNAVVVIFLYETGLLN